MGVITHVEGNRLMVEVTDGRLSLLQIPRQLLDRNQTDPVQAVEVIATTIGRALGENADTTLRELPPPEHPVARRLAAMLTPLLEPVPIPMVQGRLGDTASVEAEVDLTLRILEIPDSWLLPERGPELEKAVVETVNSRLGAAQQTLADQVQAELEQAPPIDWDEVSRMLTDLRGGSR